MVSTASEIFLPPKSKASNSRPGSEGCGGNFRTPPSQDTCRGLGHLGRAASDSREQRGGGASETQRPSSLWTLISNLGAFPCESLILHKTSRKHHPLGKALEAINPSRSKTKREHWSSNPVCFKTSPPTCLEPLLITQMLVGKAV